MHAHARTVIHSQHQRRGQVCVLRQRQPRTAHAQRACLSRRQVLVPVTVHKASNDVNFIVAQLGQLLVRVRGQIHQPVLLVALLEWLLGDDHLPGGSVARERGRQRRLRNFPPRARPRTPQLSQCALRSLANSSPLQLCIATLRGGRWSGQGAGSATCPRSAARTRTAAATGEQWTSSTRAGWRGMPPRWTS